MLAACSGPVSTLDPAGPSARLAAQLWWAMGIYASVVLLVVVGLWLYAMFRKSRTPEQLKRKVENRWILGGGVLLPLISITALLAFGIPAGHRMLPLPPDEGDALRIEVTGHQWWWEVRYPGTAIHLVDELHIPVGKPVDLALTSSDVIHSFWVPRLAGKADMLPGRIHVLRIEADEPGTYRGQCAEFCGLRHAHMKFTVEAHEPDDFEQWLETATAETQANE